VDNGSENVNRLALDYLKKQRVVVLRNLPRTPQHNGGAERAVREGRKYCGLRAGDQVHAIEVEKRMREKLKFLNEQLPRGSRGWKTSNELARAMHNKRPCLASKDPVRSALRNAWPSCKRWSASGWQKSPEEGSRLDDSCVQYFRYRYNPTDQSS